MKISPALAVFSLAGNFVLLGAVLFWSPSPSPSLDRTQATSSSSMAAAPLKPSGSKVESKPTAAAGDRSRTWEQLHDGDLAAMAARLRAAGFPASMVRAVIGNMIEERFAARLRAISSASEKPFWRTQPDDYDPKVEAELSLVRREQRALARQILGENLDSDDYRAEMLQEFGRELPLEKRERLESVKRVYEEKFSQMQEKMGSGAQLPEDVDQMRQVQKELHLELAKFLSPDELFEYDLRNSNSASSLRYQISALRPTEAEFRALYPLFARLDENFPLKSGMNTEEDMAPRQAALAQMDESIKTLLGAERFAEYQLSRNYEYQETAKVTERLNLPASVTGEIYALQRATQERANLVRANRTLAADERTLQLTALANEASDKITGILGTDGFDAYKQHGGQWLQQLAPRPRANAKAQ